MRQYYEASRALLERLIADKISFSEFIREKHSLDVKNEMYEEEVLELLGELHQEAPFLEVLLGLVRTSVWLRDGC